MPGRQGRASHRALGRINSQAQGPRFWELEGLGPLRLSTFWTLARPPSGEEAGCTAGDGAPGSS